MTRMQLIILLTAVIYAGPLGCFPTVICYGNDGHILLENPEHNHCNCSQKCICQAIHCDELCLKQNHHHCSDSPVDLTAIMAGAQKNNETDEANLIFIYPQGNSANFASGSSLCFMHTILIESYFSPLHTIILQA